MNIIEGIILIILTPFVSLVAFSVFLVSAVVFQKNRRRRWCFVLWFFASGFGMYTLFNVYDFWNYNQTGLTISPINRFCFHFFLPPSDFYDPYVTVPFPFFPQTVKVQYKHRYGGEQSIELKLVNNEPDKFKYDCEADIDLCFRGVVECPAQNIRIEFEKKFLKEHLLSGTNYFLLCQYDVSSRDFLSAEYAATIEIGGEVEAVKNNFPNSCVVIGNGTSE